MKGVGAGIPSGYGADQTPGLLLHSLNAAYHDNTVEYYANVTAGVAFDGGTGLIVYGIRDSDKLSLAAIQEEIVSGLRKYVRNELRPRHLARATLTITDLSATGVEFMLPLLPAGQSCIIGITCSTDRGYGLCAAFDHRITEGLYASRFLERLRHAVLLHLAASGAQEAECAFCHIDLSTARDKFRDKGFLHLTGPDGKEIMCCRRCLNEPHLQEE